MGKKKPYNSDVNIAISILPKENFSDKKVMRNKKTGKYDSSFKTIDLGDKGGLKARVGKLEDEIEEKGKREAKTEIQRLIVSQNDFDISNGELIPKTNRGIEELEFIKKETGELIYIGEEEFIPERTIDDFKSRDIFNNDEGANITNKELSKKTIKRLKGLGVPNSIINKMKKGNELSDIEKDVLHNRGIEYVVAGNQRPYIRKYTGGTPARLCNLKLANIKRGI